MSWIYLKKRKKKKKKDNEQTHTLIKAKHSDQVTEAAANELLKQAGRTNFECCIYKPQLTNPPLND